MQKDGEPSVEDILRSIKQVISRDDDKLGAARDQSVPGDGAFGTSGNLPRLSGSAFAPRDPFARTAFPPPPSAANAPGDEPEDEADDDVYDLAALPAGEAPAEPEDVVPEEPMQLPAAFALPEDEQADAAEEDSLPETASAQPEPQPQPKEDTLISGSAAASVRERLEALSSLSAAKAPVPGPASPLEDMVRDMLRPLLKEWLDENLDPLIERIVSEEIARITGRR